MTERALRLNRFQVRQALEGRLRLVLFPIRPQPDNPETFGLSPIWGSGVPRTDPEHFCVHAATQVRGELVDRWIACPLGKVGDRLWVQEAFAYRALGGAILYRADAEAAHSPNLWRPSVHMTREESRLTLEITAIRAGRVLDITQEEIAATGLQGYGPGCPRRRYEIARSDFAGEWNENYGLVFPFSENPFAWYVSLRGEETSC